MATRTIVTSQPDVACDVCSRRLLRGEHPDIFLAAGRRLTVCELCAPRAAHEGWLRERDTDGLALPQPRPRRGRSLFERILHGRPAEGSAERGQVEEPAPYDLFADEPPAPEAEHLYADGPVSAEPAGATAPPSETPHAPPYFEQALAIFNESEYPRRVAGVARSLGAPQVAVHSAEHLSSVVRIVVAWELCWYRYEVDLSVEAPVAQVLAQGTELSELGHEERTGNASALENGLLALAVGG